MRIPYPERIPINKAAYFALALFIIQLLEGTALYFCVGTALFILIATVTFNAAGGLTTASGAYVFFYAVLVVLIGLCYKAFLGEPAQKNLSAPRTDIMVYVGAIAAMYFAVNMSRRLSRRTGLLQNTLKESAMYRASVGCILSGALAGYAFLLLGDAGVPLQRAFSQINNLIPVGIIIGVIYEIRRSGGTRCANSAVVCGTAILFFLGATGFSKQGMFEPLVCWLLPIWALRYRLSIIQVGAGLLITFIAFHYLVPYSQYGRDLVPENATLSQRVTLAVDLLSHPIDTRQAYLKSEAEDQYEGIKGLASYYSTGQGFWDRLQMISPDDALNNFTDHGHVTGLWPISASIINVVPHVLWPDKPVVNLGNMYAHELTGETQGEGDVSTGIAFSPSGEAYHLDGWLGIFVIAPISWFILFVVYDSLLGDVRNTPWGMLGVVIFSHTAPETGITFTAYLCTIGTVGILFCTFFASWFAPILATAVLGPDRKNQNGRLSPRATLAPRIPH